MMKSVLLTGGHIANIYLSRSHAEAVTLIEQAERAFLEDLQDGGRLALIVTGPNLPLREPQWSDFLARVKPICYYLVITNSRCYTRLADRQRKLAKQHGDNPSCGSWNNGSLCDFDERTGRYVEVNAELARRRLNDLMRENVARYQRDVIGGRTCQARELEKNSNLKQPVGRIREDLAV